MSPDKLVYMANQIGKFFASQGPDKAATAIAEHLRKFWDPRMRTAIILLGIVAGLSIIATLLPQRVLQPEKASAYLQTHQVLGPIFQVTPRRSSSATSKPWFASNWRQSPLFAAHAT